MNVLCRKYQLLSFLFFIVIISELNGQEFNYWITTPGSRSAMQSGAVTAGVSDNSAIYYNPAGLAYGTNSSIAITSDGYFWGTLKIENGAGENLNLESSNLDNLPQLVSFTQKIPELPISLTIAVMNKHYSNIRTSYRQKMAYDVIPESPGDEVYIGSYNYANKIKEDWVGFGYGKKINDRLGLGFSTFFTSRTQTMLTQRSADVYKPDIDTLFLNLISTSDFSEELNYRNMGVLLILGATWEFERFKMGLSLTTPRINIKFITNSELRKSAYYNIPAVDSVARKTSIWQEKVKSVYRSPLSIDYGVEFDVNPKLKFFGKVSYFSPVNLYKVILNDNSYDIIDSLILPEEEGFSNMVLANKQIVNFAVSVQHKFSDSFEAIVGFSTDYNYLDRSKIDIESDFYPGLTYWDLYHVSGGVLWNNKKLDLSLGATYVFGSKKGANQYVNFTEPVAENYLFGYRNNNAIVSYNQFSIFVGFTFFFSQN